MALTGATGDDFGGQFMVMKNRGGLVKASRSVLMVCEATEKCFQRMHASMGMGEKLPQSKNLLPSICTCTCTERSGVALFPLG